MFPLHLCGSRMECFLHNQPSLLEVLSLPDSGLLHGMLFCIHPNSYTYTPRTKKAPRRSTWPLSNSLPSPWTISPTTTSTPPTVCADVGGGLICQDPPGPNCHLPQTRPLMTSCSLNPVFPKANFSLGFPLTLALAHWFNPWLPILPPSVTRAVTTCTPLHVPVPHHGRPAREETPTARARGLMIQD